MGAQRILFVYSGLAVGGAERQLALLAPRLASHGFEPFVATLRIRGRYADELSEAGVPTMHANMRWRADVRGALRAYRLWRTRPAIVVTQDTNAQVIGHAIARRARAPHVTVAQGGPGIWRRRGRHEFALTRLVAPYVDRVVAVTESQRPDLERLGYRLEALRLIPNAVPEGHAARAPATVRAELGLGATEFLALLVAGARPEKRVDRFIDAVALANASNASIRGVVAGGGTLLGELRDRARASRGVVRLLGERSDVPDLIGAADTVCLSSDVEGIPLSALEAMSQAKPVVATDVGGMREIVRHGETGLLVSPVGATGLARGILELANDRERTRRMGLAGRKYYLERYTVEHMVDAYAALFLEVLDESAREAC
jgi:glycosyltransferase involved in cell wall biosynthesis